jgi:hypothetical protein
VQENAPQFLRRNNWGRRSNGNAVSPKTSAASEK